MPPPLWKRFRHPCIRRRTLFTGSSWWSRQQRGRYSLEIKWTPTLALVYREGCSLVKGTGVGENLVTNHARISPKLCASYTLDPGLILTWWSALYSSILSWSCQIIVSTQLANFVGNAFLAFAGTICWKIHFSFDKTFSTHFDYHFSILRVCANAWKTLKYG